jgi:oligopeptidase B
MYDMDNRRKRKVSETKIPGFIKDQYLQKRVFAKSKDGMQVPITLVYKISLRNVSVGNPLLLTGYGAYASCSKPTWNEALLSLLDRGFVYAMAHIRYFFLFFFIFFSKWRNESWLEMVRRRKII